MGHLWQPHCRRHHAALKQTFGKSASGRDRTKARREFISFVGASEFGRPLAFFSDH